MKNIHYSAFDSTAIANIISVKFQQFRLEPYFRLEAELKDGEEFDEYVRLEIDENGEVDEVIGLEVNGYEWNEVVGLDLVEVDI